MLKKLDIGTPKPPQWYLDQPEEKIDSETLEVVTKSYGEWQKLGQNHGKYKNSKTGKYTMVSPLICASCGQKIPVPDLPDLPEGLSRDPLQEKAAAVKVLRSYKCPKCGGSASR